uniref:Uncharacterized protein n=1 Tax=Nelumbo nucifera TaxID=4432 RepID=A0A822Z7D5_NELNU|nr:TPA_asm: hypothetical protein HUJ06_013188 [Nelumbo nucifera]
MSVRGERKIDVRDGRPFLSSWKRGREVEELLKSLMEEGSREERRKKMG